MRTRGGEYRVEFPSPQCFCNKFKDIIYAFGEQSSHFWFSFNRQKQRWQEKGWTEGQGALEQALWLRRLEVGFLMAIVSKQCVPSLSVLAVHILVGL